MPRDEPDIPKSHQPPRQGGAGEEYPVASEEAPFLLAPLVTRVTLTLAYGGMAFVALSTLVTMAIGHTEHVETVLYPATFVFLLPLAAFAARYRLRLLSSRPDVSAFLVGANLAALSAILLLGHFRFDAGGTSALQVGFLLDVVLIALGNWVVTRALLRRDRPVRLPRLALAIPAVLAVGALMLFVPHGFFTRLRVSASIELGVVIALILMAAPAIRVRRSITLALDAIVVLLLIPLLTFDFNQYYGRLRIDQDYYVGPANAILHGSPMLVDTFAQYGVGVMYFLAGIFEVLPIGYGSFQLINGLLTALELVLIYLVLRVGCRSQRYALLGTSACLVAHVLTGEDVHIRWASVGFLRFGPPWVLIALAVLAAKYPERRRTLNVAMLVLVGISAIWSFETFLYTIAAYLAVVALELVLQDGSGRERTRRAGRQLVLLASVVVASHAIFAVATRVFAGQWPDWSGYLAYVRLYGWTGFGTMLIGPWSLSYLIAALYFASTAGLMFVTLEQKAFASARRVELTAIATTTAFGILSFTYFLGRSHPNNLHHIAPAAIVLSVLWVSLLARHTPVVHLATRFAVLAFIGWAAAAVIVQQPQETHAALQRSPLWQLFQSNPRITARAHALIDWRQQPTDPRAVEAQQLLDRFAPGQCRVAVLVQADLSTEALIRAHRGNLLPISDPNQNALLPQRSLALVEKRLSRLRPGLVVLTEQSYLNQPPHYQYRGGPTGSPGNADEFQTVVLSEIRRLFRYRVTATTPGGLALLILEAKRVQVR